MINEESYERQKLSHQEYGARRRLMHEMHSLTFICKNIDVFFPKLDKKTKKEKATFYFCTINPKPSVEFLDFKKSVEDYMRKRKFVYVFEQRGKTIEELGKGFHLHFIHPKKSYDKNHLHKELIRIFGHFVGNDKSIDLKPCPQSWYEDKILYMRGEKWDEKKIDSVKLNIEFRKKYNLDILYNAPKKEP